MKNPKLATFNRNEKIETCPKLADFNGNDENPDKLVAGVCNHPALDSMADIREFCQKLETLCRERGVKILTNTRFVKSHHKEDGQHTIDRIDVLHTETNEYGKRDTNATLRADCYVLATGVESYKIGKSMGVTLPVYPMRGSLMTVPIKVG